MIEKDVDGAWHVEYRDSLNTESLPCREHARKILQVLSAAVDKDLVLPPRCNQSMQEKGSLACVFFVGHWMDAKMRQIYLKEGKMSTGPTVVQSMRKRLSAMIMMAGAAQTWLEQHENKVEKQFMKEHADIKETEDIAKAIAASLDMQTQVKQAFRDVE